MADLPDEQLIQLLLHLQKAGPDSARAILNGQPQISYAAMNLMVKMGAIDVQTFVTQLESYGVPTGPRPPIPPPASNASARPTGSAPFVHPSRSALVQGSQPQAATVPSSAPAYPDSSAMNLTSAPGPPYQQRPPPDMYNQRGPNGYNQGPPPNSYQQGPPNAYQAPPSTYQAPSNYQAPPNAYQQGPPNTYQQGPPRPRQHGTPNSYGQGPPDGYQGQGYGAGVGAGGGGGGRYSAGADSYGPRHGDPGPGQGRPPPPGAPYGPPQGYGGLGPQGPEPSYGQPAAPPQPTSAVQDILSGFAPEQRAMMAQVISMSAEDINRLPPSERTTILQLRSTLGLPPP